MKNLITLLLLIFSFISLESQTVFWSAYNLKVNPGDDQTVVSAIDNFMNSEAGKAMVTMTLTSKLFGNVDQKFTHQVILTTTDKSHLAKMYTGVVQQTADFQLLGTTLNRTSESYGSYLGKSVHSVGNTQGSYTTVLSLQITDPVKYLQAFRRFTSGLNATWGNDIGMTLHQVLSGNEEGVTHVVVVSFQSFEAILDFTDKIYESQEFAALNAAVKDIRHVISNFSTVTLKRYNLPPLE